jgi:MraZ protein
MAEIRENVAVSLEPPHSIAHASVDDNGRLKLPERIIQYLDALKVTQVFITTLDMRLARIYPLPLWKRNEELFYNAGEQAERAARLAFRAKVLGGDAEIDKSGRVLLPVKLRESLGLEKQAVWLDVYNGGINLMTRKIYEEQMQLATASMADDLQALEKLGLK